MKKKAILALVTKAQHETNAVNLAVARLTSKQDAQARSHEATATEVNALNGRVHEAERIVAVINTVKVDAAHKDKLVDEALIRLKQANFDEYVKMLNWLHERLDLLANKQDAITRQHEANAAQLSRLAYTVGKRQATASQLDARLTRLEQTQPPKPPRKRGRSRKAANGPASDAVASVKDAPKPPPMIDEETAQ